MSIQTTDYYHEKHGCDILEIILNRKVDYQCPKIQFSYEARSLSHAWGMPENSNWLRRTKEICDWLLPLVVANQTLYTTQAVKRRVMERATRLAGYPGQHWHSITEYWLTWLVGSSLLLTSLHALLSTALSHP